MIAYTGDTRSRVLQARLKKHGIGTVLVRGRVRLPTWGWRWAYDNGAFEDWRHKEKFDESAFMRDIDAITGMPTRCQPAMIVLPDIVAGGMASAELSMSWLARIRHLPGIAFVVQDGMSPASLEAAGVVHACGDRIGWIFVGGSTEWKLATGAMWCAWSHRIGLPCHIGRVGSARRVLWARRCGADSIDSSLPLWSAAKMALFLGALACTQTALFADVQEWIEEQRRQ